MYLNHLHHFNRHTRQWETYTLYSGDVVTIERYANPSFCIHFNEGSTIPACPDSLSFETCNVGCEYDYFDYISLSLLKASKCNPKILQKLTEKIRKRV